MIPMHRNQSVNTHQFAMVPKPEIPRSSFSREFTHKTTFDENYLVPIYVDEVLPGDTFSLSMTAFARLTTPIYPIMDNMNLDTFFFFAPARLLWSHWVNFMGEQTNPADSIVFTVPVCSPTTGYAANTVQDYMGLITFPQINGITWSHNCLPLRAYNIIWNQWFRDENLQNSVGTGATNTSGDIGDGPDPNSNYFLLKRGKRHDYFTSCLPWTQKGGVAISIPLGTSATVYTSSSQLVAGGFPRPPLQILNASTGALLPVNLPLMPNATGQVNQAATATVTAGALQAIPTNLYADLSTATAATINQLRQSFQIQKLLERDARGGTRYTELLRAHWGVVNPDFRLQRTEYLGGGTTAVNIAPIPQTSATGLTGGTTPIGNLSAFGQMTAHNHGFTQSFTEHGYIIGLANIRGDITYQQGLRRMWSRSTRYDFYVPAFAMLGEQPVFNEEIYKTGAAADQNTFGYQERWAEYRYLPSLITGQLKSTYATPLDAWHLAEKFTTLPTLGATFIQSNVPVARVSAAPITGSHFIFDSFFRIKTTRAMPLYSVPGLIDHF